MIRALALRQKTSSGHSNLLFGWNTRAIVIQVVPGSDSTLLRMSSSGTTAH